MMPELDMVLLNELKDFIEDSNVTDMNWNGRHLWIDDLTKGRYMSEVKLSENFVKNLSTKLSNLVNENFNKNYPVLEAETKDSRISIYHEEVCKTGRSLSIRKTPPERKITRENLIKTNYCPLNVLNFLENAVAAHCNIIIGGETNAGKTEFLKYLTKFIPDNEKAITIEDNLEIHYSSINPGKDCDELKVNKEWGYAEAIKSSLRHDVTWILLSEARGPEVYHLIHAASNGSNIMTTSHYKNAYNVADRLHTMTGDLGNEKFLDNIHGFIDIALLIKAELKNEQDTMRWIDQVVIIKRERNNNTGEIENSIDYLYDKNIKDKGFNKEAISLSIKKKFGEAKIWNLFEKAGNSNE